MEKSGQFPVLFETKVAKGRVLFKVYSALMLIGICSICLYRATDAPAGKGSEAGRYAWIGLFIGEVWFTLYWLITQLVRWKPVRHHTFKQRLSDTYHKVLLPGVDIFVCTADTLIEPPVMVVNTVLSAMAYDYPSEKLNVYLSDDGGSELMFYALLQASHFAKYWIPFCKRYNIEPRSPSAYFVNHPSPHHASPIANEWESIKNKYEEMKRQIEDTITLGKVTREKRNEHKGFQEWDIHSNKHDHQAIVQILIDRRDPRAVDTDGEVLPGLVYLAREKRPGWHHNFKAGAMNALIRVSSKISNSRIILNMDCDMYSNNSASIRDALCFFMGHERIGFVQFPQNFDNLTPNDVYSNSLRIINEVEIGGLDSHGGCFYVGSGCFHRRDVLSGRSYFKNNKFNWEKENYKASIESIDILEKECKTVASCSYEHNTQWGNEMGLKYGCPVEDVITGLAIKCRGWRSVHFNPERKGFLGVAPTTLFDTLVQQKRWAEGDFQIFLSAYCPFVYGHGRIPLKLQISYCCYLLWAPNCWATLFYVVAPSYCLLTGVSLFPKLSSYWVLPFAYVFVGTYAYSLGEFYWCGGTIKGWWNDQRMWLYRRLTSYLFAFFDVLFKSMGLTNSGFVITSKVSKEDASRRYDKEMMEFGVTSPMFTILSTIALVNLFGFLKEAKQVILYPNCNHFSRVAVPMILCGLIILVNIPLYQALFFRRDNGRMPFLVTCQSTILAVIYCTLANIYVHKLS